VAALARRLPDALHRHLLNHVRDEGSAPGDRRRERSSDRGDSSVQPTLENRRGPAGAGWATSHWDGLRMTVHECQAHDHRPYWRRMGSGRAPRAACCRGTPIDRAPAAAGPEARTKTAGARGGGETERCEEVTGATAHRGERVAARTRERQPARGMSANRDDHVCYDARGSVTRADQAHQGRRRALEACHESHVSRGCELRWWIAEARAMYPATCISFVFDSCKSNRASKRAKS